MEAKAIARHVRVTPRKARRMVDLIRGKQATEAITNSEVCSAGRVPSGSQGPGERYRQRSCQGRKGWRAVP